MKNYVNDNSPLSSDNYNYIKTILDIDAYINFYITQIYCANYDFWPSWNSKFWRPKIPDGKWRWILYDLDYSFGYNGNATFETNSMSRIASFVILRDLLQYDDFQKDFIQRFTAHLNTTFSSARVSGLIESLKSNIHEEMKNHTLRWPETFSFDRWEDKIDVLEEFALKRPSILFDHINEQFTLDGTVNLDVVSSGGGKIWIEDVSLLDDNFSGKFFKGLPLRLKVEANPGFEFVGWSGCEGSNQQEISISLNNDTEITASFKPKSKSLIINEINYTSDVDFDADDWIELYNPNDVVLDLSNYLFKDSNADHAFILPENTTVLADSFLVLCQDSSKFTSMYPEVDNYVGDFNFGLSSKGEELFLYDLDGEIIDKLEYDNKEPWPLDEDLAGRSIALKNYQLDNTLGENWAMSKDKGTPGRSNNFSIVPVNPIVTSYNLLQNYPNPFNSSTTIDYDLKNNGNVKFSFYNMKGQKVEEISLENQKSGRKQIIWNADKLA